MFVALLVILTITVLYIFVKLKYQYWEKRKVLGPKPTFLFGNIKDAVLMKRSVAEVYTRIYNEHPDASLVGLYRGLEPVLLLRDPELIKEITIKSFSHFRDNDFHMDKNVDPIFGRNPFSLKGDEWKTVRGQLTPAFTSGKMKWLYPLLEDVSEKLVKFIENQANATNGEGYEAKELCTKFTLNNVASCAFGLEGKCFEEENSNFRQLAIDFFSPGSWAIIIFWLLTLFPSIGKSIPVRFCTKTVERKLVDIVSQTLKYREENNVIRKDFLEIMSQLRRNCKDYEFTDLDVTAHAAGFFIDGYETSSIVMSFVLFRLAENPLAQSRLREEIEEKWEKDTKSLSYDILQTMTYLDAVIQETLRVNPPMYTLQKLCTQSFTFTPRDTDRKLTIEKGTSIILPVCGIQNDPEYFTEPETFRPDRFLGGNIIKGTFLPLGEGPRACLGQRFGILQIKVGVAHVVKNFEMNVNKKTSLPFKFEPKAIMTMPIGGLWLNFKKIE